MAFSAAPPQPGIPGKLKNQGDQSAKHNYSDRPNEPAVTHHAFLLGRSAARVKREQLLQRLAGEVGHVRLLGLARAGHVQALNFVLDQKI